MEPAIKRKSLALEPDTTSMENLVWTSITLKIKNRKHFIFMEIEIYKIMKRCQNFWKLRVYLKLNKFRV